MMKFRKLFRIRSTGLTLFALSLTVSAFSSLFSYSQAFAQTPIKYYIFDFDGTLAEDRQVRGGSFNPKFIIYRNNQRLNLLQDIATGPEELLITAQDLRLIKDHLGNGEGRPGTVGRKAELQDGTKIQPADYYLRYPDSLRYFRESTKPGENHLLATFIEAEKDVAKKDTDTSKRGIKWQGPLWGMFVSLCETQAGADSVGIITARGHSRQEWNELFDYWLKKRYIRFKPDIDRVYNVTRPEFDFYSNHGGAHGMDAVNVPERKAMILQEIIMDMKRVNPGAGQKHELYFAEDNQENLNRVAKLFRHVAYGNYAPVRMVLINAGLTTEIRESERPEVSYIEANSKTFVSMPREQFFVPVTKQTAVSKARSCEALFSGSLK